METSKQFSLDLLDAGKGVVLAGGGAAISGIYTAVQSGLTTGHVAINWSIVGIAALAAGLSYLNKNFFTKGAIVTPTE
jgi:hypothetical protein